MSDRSFPRFELASMGVEGQPVYVNPDQVRSFQGTDDGTTITFVKDHSIAVKEKPALVALRLSGLEPN